MNILGIRELTIDGIIEKDLENIKYGGGGTAHNIIWNLKGNNYNLFIGGNAGNDIITEKELKILLKNNISTEFINIKKRNSRKVFTYIKNNKETKNVIKCPACNKDVWKSSSEYKIDYDILKNKKIDIVIFDSYTNNTNNIAKNCIENNIITILDWGIIGNLRYLSAEKIKDIKKNSYNIIQLNNKVAKFLKSRLEIETNRELFNFLNLKLLIITDGANGSIFLDELNEEKIILKINSEEIKDNNGAGDSHLASVIISCIESGYLQNKNFNLFIDRQRANIENKVKNTLKTIGSRYGYNYYNIDNIDKKYKINNCPICLEEKRDSKKVVRKFKITTSVEQIIKRVENGINEKNIKQVDIFIEQLEDKDRVLILGQGASYIAAKYIEKILNSNTKAFAKTLYIKEVIDNNEIYKYNKIVILSNSGSSADVIKVMEYLKQKEIYLITAKEYLENDNINLISYYNSKWTRERGFLSIEGIILPVLLFSLKYLNCDKKMILDIIKKASEEVEKININNFKKYSLIDVFYDNFSYELALDLESKFTESGIARVILHEKKNFSHGRFSILKNIKPDLVIYLNYTEDSYENKLIKYIENKEIDIIKIFSKKYDNDIQNLIYNIILLQYIIKKISLELNYDLSDPNYDNEDKKLYKHK
ncbi:MAG: PfkB family carbohydrate kinase [Clostridium sp.]